jgi:tRNA (guanine-N7-)-methyltransferase
VRAFSFFTFGQFAIKVGSSSPIFCNQPNGIKQDEEPSVELKNYAAKLKDRPFQPEKLNPPKDPSGVPSADYEKWVMEIGCGKGLHPILYAQENPHHGILAFERTKEKFERFKGRIHSHGLTNLHGIYEDALTWISFYRKELKEKFETLFFLYPNPYPKKNQRNKRFFSSPGFSQFLETLKPNGEIVMRSNDEHYLDEAIYLGKEVWNLELIEKRLISKDEKGITHFERKFKGMGIECWEVKWRKPNQTS